MIKKLSVLLLIFIASVGLSTAVSAAPVSQTTQAPTSYSHVSHGHHINIFKGVVARFVVSVPPPLIVTLMRLRHKYPPYRYTITVVSLGHNKYIITVRSKFRFPPRSPYI